MSEQVVEPVIEAEPMALVEEPVVEVEVAKQIRNPDGYDKALKLEREARKELERKL
jgi:hypothetical protein